MVNSWLAWQIDILLFLQNFRDITHHVFDSPALQMTTFGELVFPSLLICFILWCVNKKSGFYIILCFIYGFLINFAIKITVCIYRPWMLCQDIHPLKEALFAAGGYSFPSGHSVNSTTIYGGTAVSFWNKKILRYTLVTLIFIVMFSRLYIGVHLPQDVIIGLCLGIVLLFTTYKLMQWEEKGKNRDVIILILSVFLAVGVLLYALYKPYNLHYFNNKLIYNPTTNFLYITGRVGLALGVFFGWIVEKRFINFEIKSGVFKNIIRYIIGLIPLCLLYKYAMVLLVQNFGAMPGQFINFFLLSFYVTALYPYLIKVYNI